MKLSSDRTLEKCEDSSIYIDSVKFNQTVETNLIIDQSGNEVYKEQLVSYKLMPYCLNFNFDELFFDKIRVIKEGDISHYLYQLSIFYVDTKNKSHYKIINHENPEELDDIKAECNSLYVTLFTFYDGDQFLRIDKQIKFSK